MHVKVLYEDNHSIAVVKPAGFLSQGDNTGNMSIFGEVKKYLKEKYKKPGNVYLGLVHRLDRPVSGIILFAKTSKGAARLSEQFRNHHIEKIYHALVLVKPPKSKGVLIHHLIKDEKLRKGREKSSGKQAVLYYEVVTFSGKYSLLKIKIEGGQFHQIRSQLSLAGFPIIGDIKYGGETWGDDKTIALCATRLSFHTATTDTRVTLSIEIPKEWEKYVR